MAIPKKGTRKIVVDGFESCWYIRRNVWDGFLAIAVERADREATTTLYVDFKVLRSGSFTALFRGDPKISITPKNVAAYIRAALAAGWQPLRPGSPFIYQPFLRD